MPQGSSNAGAAAAAGAAGAAAVAARCAFAAGVVLRAAALLRGAVAAVSGSAELPWSRVRFSFSRAPATDFPALLAAPAVLAAAAAPAAYSIAACALAKPGNNTRRVPT